jgi:lipopolysaccharide export system protein LptC
MHKRTAHRWRLIIIMMVGGFLAFGSYWMLHLMESSDAVLDPDAFKNEPDYIVEKFSFVRMTPEGKPHYVLSGARLTHRPVNDSSDVELPVLQNIAPGAPQMTIVAQRARILNAGNQVDLNGKVDIQRPASPTTRSLRLRTEKLTVFPDEDRMQSDQQVTMQLGDTVITGTGMRANNATRQIHFARRSQIVDPPGAAR